MLKDAYTLVTVNYLDLFSENDLAYERQWIEKCNKSDITVAHWLVWDMIHFHSIGHVADTTPGTLEFICYESYFVTAFYQALTELIPVSLDAAELWEGEVSANKDAILVVFKVNFAVWGLGIQINSLTYSWQIRLVIIWINLCMTFGTWHCVVFIQ